MTLKGVSGVVVVHSSNEIPPLKALILHSLGWFKPDIRNNSGKIYV